MTDSVPHSNPSLERPGPNDAVRLAIEIAALVGVTALGWSRGAGAMRWFFAVLFVVIGAGLWAVFRVDAPDEGGRPVVPIAGPLRLLLEAVVLGAGAWGMAVGFGPVAAAVYSAAVVAHYVAAHDRVRRLLRAGFPR